MSDSWKFLEWFKKTVNIFMERSRGKLGVVFRWENVVVLSWS